MGVRNLSPSVGVRNLSPSYILPESDTVQVYTALVPVAHTL